MKYCVEGGWLVSLRDWVPDEPYTWYWSGLAPRVGCARIRCGRCGELVRDGVFEIDDGATVKAPRLFNADDWSDVPGVSPSAHQGRLYACYCRVYQEHAATRLQPDAPDPVFDAASEWRCDGHLRLARPTELDGIQLDGAGRWEALVDRALSGSSPPTLPWPDSVIERARHPAFWLVRLFALIDDPAARTALAQAVAARLTDGDAIVRRGALDFFDQHRRAPGADAVAVAARDHADLFFGVADPLRPGRDLGEALASALQSRLTRLSETGDAVALEVARAFALAGAPLDELLHYLAPVDAAWIAHHAGAIVTARASQLPDLLVSLQADPALLEMAIGGLQAAGVEADAIRSAVDAELYGQAATVARAALDV